MHPDLDSLVRREFGLGAKEPPGRVHHARDPRVPQFDFEWHPDSQRVYRIDLPGSWHDGQWVPEAVQARGFCIAEHCLTHGQFVGFVQTFARGYLLAVAHHGQGRLCSHAPVRILEGDPCPTR